jgi:hypothetical protein
MADYPVPSSTGLNPTPAPTPGEPGIGFDDTLPSVDPTTETEPVVTVVDWPPAIPQGPSDPADTPGWKDCDDLFPATEGGADGMDTEMNPEAC